MDEDEAAKVLEHLPSSGTTNAEGFARMVEAFMVSDGRDRDAIKAAVESVLGRPLNED